LIEQDFPYWQTYGVKEEKFSVKRKKAGDTIIFKERFLNKLYFKNNLIKMEARIYLIKDTNAVFEWDVYFQRNVSVKKRFLEIEGDSLLTKCYEYIRELVKKNPQLVSYNVGYRVLSDNSPDIIEVAVNNKQGLPELRFELSYLRDKIVLVPSKIDYKKFN
jgi:hypothetical protein